jgi:diguanylate cyclase (GGDEF)-like protein
VPTDIDDPLSGAARGQRPRVRTVRGWLFLLALACTLPASLLGALYIAHDYREGRARLAHDSLGTARALTSALDRELAGFGAALMALASSPSLVSQDLAAFHGQAQQVQRGLDILNVVLIDRSRRQALNTLLPFGSPLPAVEPNRVLTAVLDSGKASVTDLFAGPVAKRPLLAVGVPVFRGETPHAVLAAGVPPERLARILIQQQLPPDWVADIFDSTGTIVARTHDMERFIGRKGSPELVRRMLDVREDAFERETRDGIAVLTVFSRSAFSNWSVAISIPRESLVRELRGSLLALVAATVVLVASALAAAWGIGRRLADAMRALVEPAGALGRGEAVVVPSLALAEANEVACALSRASGLLQQALHRAHHDPLTGLANRTLFEQFIRSQIAVCGRTGAHLAILYLDLDGFKSVNDRLGHARGDELLRSAAKRLDAGVRDADLVARLGGDEFAVALVDTDGEGAQVVAAKLVDTIGEEGSPTGAAQDAVAASIGISVFPETGTSAEELLHQADQAMYRAKAQGKGRVVMAAARWARPARIEGVVGLA